MKGKKHGFSWRSHIWKKLLIAIPVIIIIIVDKILIYSDHNFTKTTRMLKDFDLSKLSKCCSNNFFMITDITDFQITGFYISESPRKFLVPLIRLVTTNGSILLKIVKNDRGSKISKESSRQEWDELMEATES